MTSPPFIKFPSTPHLAVLPGVDVRDDKILSPVERDAFLANEVIVEEKIDGANLGISFDCEANCRVQNRGAYLLEPFSGQWARLDGWLQARRDGLFDVLGDRFVLFGEWCVAVHSIRYSTLPDWFLGFDVYDRTERCFMNSSRRDALFDALAIHAVPRLAIGHQTLDSLKSLLGASRVGNTDSEGVYLRVDAKRATYRRAKLVRPAFVQAISEHWSRKPVRQNRLAGMPTDAHLVSV